MAPSTEYPKPLKLALRLWLWFIALAGVGYAFVIPTFQTVDETAHWDRLWTVAQGQYNCETLPADAAKYPRRVCVHDCRIQPVPIPGPYERWRRSWSYTHAGPPESVATAACTYPPVAYLLPAAFIAAFLGDSADTREEHAMFVAFYGGRLVNWALFFCSLWFALRISRYPIPILLFGSIPAVVHQSVSLNNDAFQFAGALLVGALATRRPTHFRLLCMTAVVALMSSIKPTCVIFSTLILIQAFRGHRAGTLRARAALAQAAASLLVPLAAFLAWKFTTHLPLDGTRTVPPVTNLNMDAQLQLLLDDPWRVLHVLYLQAEQLFTSTTINGSWHGIFLALAWYGFAAPRYVYALAVPACALGLWLLRAWRRGPVSEPLPRWLTITPMVASVCYFAFVTLLLHLAFTPVGQLNTNGVQGRYYLLPIALLLFARPVTERSPRPHQPRWTPTLTAAMLLLSVLGHAAALYALYDFWWLRGALALPS